MSKSILLVDEEDTVHPLRDLLNDKYKLLKLRTARRRWQRLRSIAGPHPCRLTLLIGAGGRDAMANNPLPV